MDVPMSPDMWSDSSNTENLGDDIDEDAEVCLTDDDGFNSLFKTPLAAAKKRATSLNRSLGLSNTRPKISQIPESLLPIVDQHDTSWTSSLATPITGDVANNSWTNFNTEERKVLLPCRDETPGRRILFAEDDCKNVASVWNSQTPKSVGFRNKNSGNSLQSTPNASVKGSDSPSTKPNDIQLSPILGAQDLNENQTPLSSSARFGRNRRPSSESRMSLVSKNHPKNLKESSSEEERSPSILAGQTIVTFSPPKSPIIGLHDGARNKNRNARLSLKSNDIRKIVTTENLESELNLSTNIADIICCNEEVSLLRGSFPLKTSSEDIMAIMPTNAERAPWDIKSHHKEDSNNQNSNPLAAKQAKHYSSRSTSLSGKCSLEDLDNDSTQLSDSFSLQSGGGRNITSSPIISCNKIMKRKRKHGTLSLSSNRRRKRESSSSLLKNPKNSRSSEASRPLSQKSTPKAEFCAVPTTTSRPDSSPLTETIMKLDSAKETLQLPVYSSGSPDVPFGFTSQNDLSINTMQEICKVSDLIELVNNERRQPTPHTSSKKIKFVSASKKDEHKSMIEIEPKCAASRVQQIKTKSDLAKSINFLYPNVRADKKKYSSNMGDINQLLEYAHLLEVVANLDGKVANKCKGRSKTSDGFVQFSKMKQEAMTSECDKTLLRGNEQFLNVTAYSSNCDLTDRPQQKEVVQVSQENTKKERLEISGTQITRLVKDAQIMFETEDSQWGYNLPNIMGQIKVQEGSNRVEKSSTNHELSHKLTKNLSTSRNSPLKKCELLDMLPSCESVCLNLDNNTPKTRTNRSKGFDSASGNNINASDSALNTARTLFGKDGTQFEGIDTPKGSAGNLVGFSSASGKELSISKVVMDNARKLFDEFESPIGKDILGRFTTPKVETLSSLGFTSASGKKLAVSDVAINKARKLFNEVDLASREEIADCDTPKVNSKMSGGFTSASGKTLKISEASMTKARTLFDEFDTLVDENADVNTPKLNSKITVGFTTASGKKFSVSDASMHKARTFFEEVDSTFNENKNNDTPKPMKNIPMGFSSASGKQFNVSEASIEKARTLFDNVESSCGENKDSDTPKPMKNTSMGFSSASGKKFNVSEASIEKARTLFDDVESSFGGNKDSDTPKPMKNTSMGFSSASGKKFNVSEDSIKKARTLFDNVESTFGENTNAETPNLKNKIPMGFSSASGKKFSVSDASIKKARTLFRDEDPWSPNKCDPERADTPDIQHQPTELHSNRPKNSAFKRPSSTDIPHAKLPDETVPDKLDDITSNYEPKQFGGFLAASGRKTAAVSESSLLEAKILFSRSAPAKDSDQNDLPLTSQKPPVVKKEYDCSIITPNFLQNDIDIAEVMQATEAFMADEESGVPPWITTYTSSPSVSNDRMDHQKPMVDGTVDKESPILGQHDRFRPKKRKPAARLVVKPKPSDDVTVFKTPYKRNDLGTTPAVNSINNKKRGADFEFGTPFAKRVTSDILKPAEASKQAELSTEEVCQLREEAWERQKKAVKSKDSLSCRPCQGSQLLRKQDQQMTWKSLTQGNPPGQYSRAQLIKLGVREAVVNVTAENAGDFVFSSHDHYGPSVCRGNTTGLPVGDAALLVLDGEGRADGARVESAFLASPGVDPRLVPDGWVQNHRRWIVWKLAATERSFPRRFAARCLTPNALLLQLKYRYDREIDRCERPALRRVLEQDDSATRRLVLCVAAVVAVVGERRGFELWLTDGWYSVMASLDSELNRIVAKGVVSVGTKLIVHGAELSSREACYPLEAKEDVRLRLSANSTRRARWHAKLGFQPNPGPLRLPLGALLPAGGMVGRVDVCVARVYPTLYVEMLENGGKVTRSELAESRAAAAFERRRQDRVESAYAKVRAELQDERRAAGGKPGVRCSARNLAAIASGSQLSRLLDQSPDPASMQELLSGDQLAELYKHRQQENESTMREVETRVQQTLADEGEKRKVSTLLKIRCTELGGDEGGATAVLSVWRAPEDLPGLLREGAAVSVFNVAAAGRRLGCLQLTAGRQTRYLARRDVPTGLDPLARRLTGLAAAALPGFRPPFGELDVAGVVVDVVDGTARLQTAYLADARLDLIGIAFWAGLKEAGLDELLKPGAAVGASDLQWRGGPQRRVAHVHAAELSAFSRRPRQPHLRTAVDELCAETKHISDFVEKARDKLMSILQDTKMPSDPPPTVSNPNPTTPQAPKYVPTFCPPTPQMSPLDPELPSPAQRRIEKLRCYNDPPPLPPLPITSSQAISKEFRLPARSVPDETKPSDEYDSPPLSLESG